MRSGLAVSGKLVLDVHGARIRFQGSTTLHRDTTASLVHASFHVLAGRRQISHSIVDNDHFDNYEPRLSLNILLIRVLSFRLTTTATSSDWLPSVLFL